MRTDLESRLRVDLLEDGYLEPSYDSYCFANVPETVRRELGVVDGTTRALPEDVLADVDNSYERVFVVLVDGFGLELWKRHREDHPLLERIEERGTVTPLTSIYPSETAAALTTFHTGRLPTSHGVLGWEVYDPADDASYEAFSTTVTAGDESTDYELQDVFVGDPIYPALEAAGVDCRHVVPFAETYDGATCHSYGTVDGPGHGLEGLEEAVEEAFTAAADPAYLFAYLPQVDTVAHAYGTTSDPYREAVRETFDALDRALSGLGDTAREDTLVLLTADHGHVDTDPDRNVDLERFDDVMAALERHGTGEPVRYAGSPRNVHLHLREPEESRDDIRETLEDALEAQVITREEALECGLFGRGEQSQTFRRRLGDLVVCHRELSVWYGSDRPKLELVGMHGGLHPDEMLVPFAAVDLEAVC
ncbi:alkaline phosphatase family protein [Natrarchaeobaculum sulfurireducens]|nr:nucleotide pyrophosphatase/phosphodiesterase family protein [Natrarchaeobaculum sulfurireducens]AXR78400.1 hypothetical protein AArc1_2082 [Natrarchaeobaculum sulfurireducens]